MIPSIVESVARSWLSKQGFELWWYEKFEIIPNNLDAVFNIPTQFVMKANVLGKDRGPNVQTIHNICLKLNSKIGKYVSNDNDNTDGSPYSCACSSSLNVH